MSISEKKTAEVTTRPITRHSSLSHNTILSLQTPTYGKRNQQPWNSLSSMAAGKNSLFSRETENLVPLVQTLTGILDPITHSHQSWWKKRVREKVSAVFKIKRSKTGLGRAKFNV